ncbi:MAG: type II toxin-antitoxin system RelB/DinJ family antitoxin [Treponema sp.]|jgi:DNA-damage-inducible protein J|nr:type II toxin-antitoxin system RelB/DinJ family antitoxin [Treponema sp.]
MAQLNIRLDDTVKEQAETLFNRMGLTMSAAVTLFLHQVILHNAIPFKISAHGDPLYNPANIARIKDSINQFTQGKFSEKSLEELERMADE